MFHARSEPGPAIGSFDSLEQARHALASRLDERRRAGDHVRFNDRLQFELRSGPDDTPLTGLLWIEDDTGLPVASTDAAEGG